jgi:hypothetical protein
MALDPNLVAAQWGLLGAFGVAVTLLIPKADQYRQDYLRTGNVHEGDRARKWGALVRTAPVVVLAGLVLLSVLASPLPGNGPDLREDYTIVAAPIVAQAGFIYLVMRLIPRMPKGRRVRVRDPRSKYLPSPESMGQTVITITNSSDRPLTLWWLDGSGTPDDRAVPVETIDAGKNRKQATKAWHYWLLRTQYGVDVGFIQAKDEPTAAEVTQERVDRFWQEPQKTPLLPVPAQLPASPPTAGNAVAVIDNKSDQLLILYWLDRTGRLNDEPRKRPVPPGTRYELGTRPEHYWVVQTTDGRNVGLIHVGAGPTVTIVTQAATDGLPGRPAPEAGVSQPGRG